MGNSLITEIDALDEIKDCFLTYTEEVLTDRAVPSAEDGLLSVHRKLIWTMEELLKMSNKSKHKKSASIVGSTLASSYFHGDAACYGALCKIAQPYLMRYPLVDGDGNLGTQEGNGMEAAARYTNARPSAYADLMMESFKKNVVPLKETYNGEYMEPIVLPSLLPNAIVNGRETIAIGLAHNSLPNNLSEVCDAIIVRLQKNASLTIEEVMKYIKGPDFPLGGVVVNSKDIKTAFETGHSAISLKVRGDYEIKNDTIIFNTIPYRTYRNKIKEQINKNINVLDEFLEDFSDESNCGINKLVFKVKKGIDPDKAVLKLFALTDLQTTLSYNMNYIVNGTPKMCSMMELIDAYVNHQTNVLLAATAYDKNKAEKRAHIIEGLLIILNNIDKAIKLIKESLNPKEAKEKLQKEFKIDEEQSKAILDMKLSRLTKLDREDLFNELQEKKKIIEECNKIINEEFYRNNKIIEKVQWLKDKYGDARRTKLENIEIPKEEKEEEQIIPMEVVVMISQNGAIKRVPKSSFKAQKKGGKGVKSQNDALLSVISTNTVNTLMLFSSKGKMYKILVNNIPEGTRLTKGIPINNLLKMEMGEKIIAATAFRKDSPVKYVVFFTKKGLIKKTKIEEYEKLKGRVTGLISIKLKEGDSIANVLFLNEEDVILISKKGMTIHCATNTISPIGRNTSGVKGIKLAEDDEIIGGYPIHKETDYLMIATSNGHGKKCSLDEFPLQSKGGKGVSVNKTEDDVIGAAMIDSEDIILLSGPVSAIAVTAAEIPLLSRTAAGTKLSKNNIDSVIKL